MRSINIATLFVAGILLGICTGIFSTGCSSARFDAANIDKELRITYQGDTACIYVRATDTVNHVTLGPWLYCTPVDSILAQLGLVKVATPDTTSSPLEPRSGSLNPAGAAPANATAPDTIRTEP